MKMGLWHLNHKPNFRNSLPRKGTIKKYAIIGLCFVRESAGNSDPRSRHYCGSHGNLDFGYRSTPSHFVPIHHWLAGPVCRYLPRRTFGTGSGTGSSVPEGGFIHGRGWISVSYTAWHLHPTLHKHFWTTAAIT
jgi:hypothetical protein